MQEQSIKKIAYAIENNKKAIKNKQPKIAWAKNLTLRHTIQARHKSEIRERLSILRAYHAELLPFVKKIKSHVTDITELTHVCAIYLLLCHIFDNWNSFFLLGEKGKHSAAGNLLRMINEGIMTIQLFAVDFLKKDRTNLNRWFSGYIVTHGIGREKVGDYLDKHSPYPEVDEKKLSSHVYQIESQASHNAYLAVLESVSPFTEDFDFDGYTGFYRIISWLRAGSLTTTNITLKLVYSSVIKNKECVAKLNEILMRYEPTINDGIDKEDLKDFLK